MEITLQLKEKQIAVHVLVGYYWMFAKDVDHFLGYYYGGYTAKKIDVERKRKIKKKISIRHDAVLEILEKVTACRIEKADYLKKWIEKNLVLCIDQVNLPDIFRFEIHPVKFELDENGDPWFLANDVCEVLGFENSRRAISTHVTDDDVTKRNVIDSLNREQQANFVNESGLYSLMFGSKLPKAKKFKRWVTKEVLPAIRKYGVFSNNIEFMNELERQNHEQERLKSKVDEYFHMWERTVRQREAEIEEIAAYSKKLKEREKKSRTIEGIEKDFKRVSRLCEVLGLNDEQKKKAANKLFKEQHGKSLYEMIGIDQK